MNEFRDQDLTAARFERVSLREATFTDVYLDGARLRDVNLVGADVRAVCFNGSRMRGVELVDVQISGEVQNLVVNGVDVAPLIEAELDRRTPERAAMRPDDSDGFRAAWTILERLWDETVARARTLPAETLDRTVDDEWSFIQTLRHLGFATACWIGRTVLGQPSPWHPLDLPWDEAPDWKGIPVDRDARPSLDEVLAIRRARQAMVRTVLDSLTDDQLDTEVSPTGPGWPAEGMSVPVKKCLRVVLNEEWEHRLYAERDLSRLQDAG